jgi:O-antigen ligase
VLIWIALPSPMAAILAPLAVLGLVLAILFPYLVCVTFFTMTYCKIADIAPVLQPLDHVLSALSVLTSFALVWHGVLARTSRPYINQLQVTLVLFWMIISINVLFAQNHSLAYQAWSDFSKTLFLSLAIPLFFREERHLLIVARLFVFGGVVISVSSLYHYYAGDLLIEGTRASAGAGLLGNPNDLALILLLPLSFAGSSLVAGSRLVERAWSLVGVLLITTGIIFTQSRGGLLGTMTVLAFIGSRFVKSKALLICGGLVIGGLLYTAAGVSDRVSGGDKDVTGESVQNRVYAWRAGINMGLTHPVTGVGIGNFADQYWNYSPVHTHHAYTAHSIWLLVLGENGLAGLLTFVAMIISCFRVNIVSARRLATLQASAGVRAFGAALITGLAGFCVSGSFLSYSYQWPLYVILGLTVSLAGLANRTAPPPR